MAAEQSRWVRPGVRHDRYSADTDCDLPTALTRNYVGQVVYNAQPSSSRLSVGLQTFVSINCPNRWPTDTILYDTIRWAILLHIIMVALCNRADHYIFILFLSFFLSSSFFPRQISAVGDWMFIILWHMVWP